MYLDSLGMVAFILINCIIMVCGTPRTNESVCSAVTVNSIVSYQINGWGEK